MAALDEFSDLLDDVGIGEGGDVASVHAVRNGGQDAAHDFAGAGLGHVRNDVDALGARDLADHGFDGGDDLVDDLLVGRQAGLDGDVDLGDAALDFVDDRNDSGFGDFWDAKAGGFDFLGAEAMAGDVDDVVYPTEDAVVAVGGERGGAGAARLHTIERGFCGAEKTAGFGLPPGVHDSGFAFADDFVIPAPNFRLNGFANSGHVLEGVVVFSGLVGAGFAEHSNGGGGSVEDVDAEAFGDTPGASGVGELRDAFIEDAGGGESERAVHDVRVAGDPADVGHAPVDVAGLQVLVI